MEGFDDVGVEGSQGHKIAEQDKSTHVGNPVRDRAVDLWKTLSNWLTAIESGELQIGKTVFALYVSQPRTGQIVSRFSEAKTAAEADRALREA